MTLLVTFIILNALNVVIQTVKSLCTVNSGKEVAAIVNALAYGLYTVVVVYMVCELPLWEKAVIIGLCNLIGVYVVKLIEEKSRRDKLWKVEVTLKRKYFAEVVSMLDKLGISYNWIDLEKWYLLNIYCATQKESALVKNLVNRYHAKYFVTETKNL